MTASHAAPSPPLRRKPKVAAENAAKEWGFGTLHENAVVEQEFVEFVASGDIADGFGAGPVQMAAGASYRQESIANIARPTDIPHELRTDFLIQYGDSFSSDVDVSEVFSEIDIPFHERFSLNVAGRLSEYQNTAGAGTGVEGSSSRTTSRPGRSRARGT